MSTNRKYIDPKAPDLPANFVAIDSGSWADALKTFDHEFKKAPKNFGNFKDAAFTPSPELVALIDKLARNGSFEVDTYGMADEAQMDNALGLIFNDIAEEARLDAKEKATLKQFTSYLRGVVKPLLQTWPGKTNVSLQLRTDFGASAAAPYFNPGRIGNNPTWKIMPFYGASFNVMASFNTASGAFYDHKQIASAKNDEYNETGLIRYDINKIKSTARPGDEWRDKPWSLSVITPNIWTHTPVAQTMPVRSDPGKPEKRAYALINVSRIESPFMP